MEMVENGRSGHANTAKSHEHSLPMRKSRHEDQAVSTSAKKTSVIESGLAITCIPCVVFVVLVVLVVLKNLTERFIRLVFEEFAPVGNPAEQVIKAGNDQDPNQGADEHPAGCGGANCAVSDRPGAGGKDQRKETGDEGEGGHLNRPEAQFSAFDGCLLEGHALPAPLDREFDDQDRVLAQQTDQHDQTNLGVDVVGQSHGLQEQEGTEEPDRQRQDHGQRQYKTLVLPDQYQIDEGDYDEEDINRLLPLS